MSKQILQNNYALALAAGLANVLAFSPICIWPFIFLTPALLFVAVSRCKSYKEALICGYLCSLVIMVGGFYWVTYTLQLFGHMPWIVAALLFVLFCGFGALNFPVFTLLAFASLNLFRSLKSKTTSKKLVGALFFSVFAPALFTVVEWVVPKLFPWAIAHTFFFLPLATQIAELTGASSLSFATCVAGGSATWLVLQRKAKKRTWPTFRPLVLPLALWTIILGFGAYRLNETPSPTRNLRVAMVQANIGSLERLQAAMGSGSRIQQTIERHRLLTEQALSAGPPPDLIVWPETAMPFLMDVDHGYAGATKKLIQNWGIPLLTGAYAQVKGEPFRDYNAAFLLTPTEQGMPAAQVYEKNILLAFGEYFPFGDTFPVLYRWFPQVSDFKRGTEQKILSLADGTRIGVTVCYEAIVPSFTRKVAAKGVQILINLTNDSWFGPTSEPYQHGALSIFRAIEARVPLVRVTNTGRTFTVDAFGRMGESTPIFEQAVLTADVAVPTQITSTLFLQWGNWLVWLLFLVCAGLTLPILLEKPHVPILTRIRSRR